MLPLDIEKEIVERARKVLYSESTPIPEILTDIRHFGGDKTLIDLTRSLPVALFFGCNGRFDADGRIIAVPVKRLPQRFSLKHYKESIEAEEEEKEKISEKDRMEYSEAEKKMSFLNPSRTFSSRARTEFQSSIFIHAPKGYLDEAESGYVSIILPKNAKRECLQFLDRCHNIRHDTIYNDLVGYIENEKNTKNGSHWFYFGLSRLRRGEYEKAIKCFNRSIFHNPKNGSVWFYRGRAKSALGKNDEAIFDFERASELK